MNAAEAGLARIELIRISIVCRMESPDGTYMSHDGAPVGCQVAPWAAPAGPVFRRAQFRVSWAAGGVPKFGVPE